MSNILDAVNKAQTHDEVIAGLRAQVAALEVERDELKAAGESLAGVIDRWRKEHEVEQDSLIEPLAAYAHEAWSGWMKYMFSKMRPATFPDSIGGRTEAFQNDDWVMPAPYVQRWVRQMNAPYATLPEHERESDRKEAREILATIQKATTAPTSGA